MAALGSRPSSTGGIETSENTSGSGGRTLGRWALLFILILTTICVPSFPGEPPSKPLSSTTPTKTSLGFNQGKGVSGILDEDAYQEELEMAKRSPGNESVYAGRAMREADLLRQFVEGFHDSKECSDISLYLKTDRKPEFTLTIVVSGRDKTPIDQAWTWAFSEAHGMGGFGMQSTAKLTARDICLTIWDNLDPNHFKKPGMQSGTPVPTASPAL